MKTILSCAGVLFAEAVANSHSIGVGTSTGDYVTIGIAACGAILAVHRCASDLFWQMTDAFDADA